MKNKLATILFLITVSITTVFAEGDMPNTGRNCPGTQTCIVQETSNNEKVENDKTFLPFSLFNKIRNFIDIFG